MQRSKVNLRKVYTKIAVKTPILVLTVVAITMILLYYFSITSTLGVFKNFEAEIKADKYGNRYIEAITSAENFDSVNENSRVFWYINKEKAVYNAIISEKNKQNDKLRLIIIPSKKDFGILDKADKVNVDIEVGKKTLLDRLFKKGINNDEAK